MDILKVELAKNSFPLQERMSLALLVFTSFRIAASFVQVAHV